MFFSLADIGEKIVTISNVLPTLDSMRTVHLKTDAKDRELTNEIRDRVINHMLVYYDSYETIAESIDYLEMGPVTQLLLAATFVDPRYKGAYCKSELMAALVQHLLLLQGDCLDDPDDYNMHAASASNVASVEVEAADADLPHAAKRCKGVLDSFIVNRAQNPAKTANISLHDKIDSEISVYVMSPPSVDEDEGYILSYWKANYNCFPLLGRLAKHVLCVPATSVPCERMFSVSGHLSQKKRACMKPSTLQELLFLSAN